MGYDALHRALIDSSLSQLVRIAYLTGINQSGTIPILRERLATQLDESRLPVKRGAAAATHRVLSVDFGVRNLAYCLLSVPDAQLNAPPRKQHPTALPMRRVPFTGFPQAGVLTTTPTLHSWAKTELDPSAAEADSARSEPSKWSPDYVAPLVRNLVCDVILPLRPTCVVLERQRFRSSGAMQVLEWTLRVNTVENMVWAVLEALQPRQGKAYEVNGVEPRRVADYWASETEGIEGTNEGVSEGLGKKERARGGRSEKKAKSTREKKRERIANAEKLFEGENQLILETEEVKETAQLFSEGKGKLDDKADCLLQGIAWIEWEKNRREINAILDWENAG